MVMWHAALHREGKALRHRRPIGKAPGTIPLTPTGWVTGKQMQDQPWLMPHAPLPAPPCCAAGEYIAVEKIESVLEECPLVNQIWVHGNRFESYLVCVVVPSKAKLEVRGASGGGRVVA